MAEAFFLKKRKKRNIHVKDLHQVKNVVTNMAGRYMGNHSLRKRNTFEPILILKHEQKKRGLLDNISQAKWNDAALSNTTARCYHQIDNVCVPCLNKMYDQT